MINKALFSSATDMWETPKDLFDELNEEFRFQTDVCAVEQNAKCKYYYTPEQDWLKQIWAGVCWCNQPYGRGIEKWMEKAYKSNATVVCLVPARTDTRWFHEFVLGKAEIRFIRGRLKFGNSKNSAPFPSMLVIYRKDGTP